jgi:hypothetical protein
MFVFFSSIFLYSIYLFTFVFKICLFIQKGEILLFILHSLWYTPLVYVFMNLFFQCDLLCLFFVVIFSQPDVNITWGGRKIHEYRKPKAPTIFFQLHLSNLLALRNKLNPKSVLMECMFFFSSILLYSTYLYIYLQCLFFVVIFSQPDVNITWITGHIHRSIVDKIDLTSEDVERVKNTWSITLGYIFLWNVIRRIYDQ